MVHTIVTTLFTANKRLVAVAVLLAFALIAVIGSQHVPTRRALMVFASIALSAATALVYFAQNNWLVDQQRVAIPVGLSLWFSACLVTMLVSTSNARLPIVTVLVVGGTLLGSVQGYAAWTSIAATQQAVLNVVGPIRAQIPAEERLVILDPTSSLRWDTYHMFDAFNVTQGPGAVATVCEPEGAPPGYAPPCAPLINGTITDLGTVTANGIELRLLAVAHN
jgi:hypothetical protein